MTDENWQYFPEMDNEPFTPHEALPSREVTSWEAQAVDEMISEELNAIYHERIALSQGVCPVCYTELSEDCHDIDDDLEECVYYCPHCGYESDPRYD